MPRPKKKRRLRFLPQITYFKPLGLPMKNLKEVTLKADEMEAIKLKNYDDLQQIEAAEKMNISQPTFARILRGAYKKISEALVEGHAIKIKSKK